jgi:hypothetical protein
MAVPLDRGTGVAPWAPVPRPAAAQPPVLR